MSIGQYLLGGAAGLVFGLLVAAGNTLLLRRSLQRAKQTQGTVMGTSGLRQVINLADRPPDDNDLGRDFEGKIEKIHFE